MILSKNNIEENYFEKCNNLYNNALQLNNINFENLFNNNLIQLSDIIIFVCLNYYKFNKYNSNILKLRDYIKIVIDKTKNYIFYKNRYNSIII